jgi:hypothetical protein
MKTTPRIWLARTLIGMVLTINVQSALVFLANPAGFTPAYELTGISGQAAIRGFGTLFLMWNIPYLVALIHPIKYRISLYETIAMQSIGLIGESWILWSLPVGHSILRDSIFRFIMFDGGGLIALILAAGITKSVAHVKS